jgi:transcriptional regulator with GAF, ATPase, and Fis domain
MRELATTYLQKSRDLLGVIQGALYVTDAQQTPPILCLAGAAACATEPPHRLALGETLLGQCAQERRQQIIATPPDGYWTVRSGLGGMPPAALLLAPLVMHNNLVGALELALLHLPDTAAQVQLDESLALLATSIEILSSNLRLNQLAQSSLASEEAAA